MNGALGDDFAIDFFTGIEYRTGNSYVNMKMQEGNFDFGGEKSWEYICDVENEDTENLENDYPIFDYANKYGTDFADSFLNKGWYIPSIVELYDLYSNKEIIQSSLDLLNVSLLFRNNLQMNLCNCEDFLCKGYYNPCAIWNAALLCNLHILNHLAAR